MELTQTAKLFQQNFPKAESWVVDYINTTRAGMADALTFYSQVLQARAFEAKVERNTACLQSMRNTAIPPAAIAAAIA